MTDISAFNFDDFVTLAGDRLVTTSRLAARRFKKQHHHVVQKIESIECSDSFRTRNFSRVTYEHNGNTYVEYEMTKDGFVMLAMGFTGKSAMGIKEAYIEAFNAMAERIQSQEKNLWQQMQALIAEEVESQVRASFGSRLMHIRKKEIPPLGDKRCQLEQEIQPPLFLN